MSKKEVVDYSAQISEIDEALLLQAKTLTKLAASVVSLTSLVAALDIRMAAHEAEHAKVWAALRQFTPTPDVVV